MEPAGYMILATLNPSTLGRTAWERHPTVVALLQMYVPNPETRFRVGLVFKAHRLVYHSSLGLRVRKKERKEETRNANPQTPNPVRTFQPIPSALYPIIRNCNVARAAICPTMSPGLQTTCSQGSRKSARVRVKITLRNLVRVGSVILTRTRELWGSGWRV